MSGLSGRALTISRNGVLIATARAKTLRIDHEPADISTTFARQLLTTQAKGSKIDIEVEGVVRNGVLLGDAIGRAGQTIVEVELAGNMYTGSYLLTQVRVQGEYRGASTFTATLESSAEFGPTGSGANPDATFITAVDETGDLPNSRRVAANDDIVPDLTADGELRFLLSDSVQETLALAETAVQPEDLPGGGGGADPALTYATISDETADLPNSRRLVAGSNVTLSSAVTGQLVISASGGGGGGGGGGLFAPVMSSVPTVASVGFDADYGSGSCTLTDTDMGVYIECPASTTPKITSAPAPPYTITAMFIGDPGALVGLAWSNGTAGQGIYNNAGSTAVQSNNNPTSFNSIQNSASNVFNSVGLTWLRLRDDGTSVYFEYSNNGAKFKTLYSVAKASGFLGSSGYSSIVMQPNGGGATSMLLASWSVT